LVKLIKKYELKSKIFKNILQPSDFQLFNLALYKENLIIIYSYNIKKTDKIYLLFSFIFILD